MILLDTSLWIGYFIGKIPEGRVESLLLDKQIMGHPWVTAELLLGHLSFKQKRVLTDLSLLQQVSEYPLEDILPFIEKENLRGKGIGLVDVQLLYGCLVENVLLWTQDKKLKKLAQSYDIAF